MLPTRYGGHPSKARPPVGAASGRASQCDARRAGCHAWDLRRRIADAITVRGVVETEPRDPAMVSIAALGLGLFALGAIIVPAWRGTAVDRLEAMRPQ